MSDPFPNLKVFDGTLTERSIWEEKDEWAECEAKSLKEWERMDQDQQEAIFEIIGRALDRMHDQMERWVPHSLRIEQGRYFDVVFRVLFTELEAEQRSREEITQRRIDEAAREMAASIEEIEHGSR